MHTIISAIATILVPGSASFLVPYLILRASGAPLERPFGILQLLAVLMAAAGVFLIVWVSTTFVRRGKGTPVPIEPPVNLVTEGLYRRMRNPMYTGAVLAALAWAVYFASFRLLLYAAGLWLLLHTFLVILEEPQLRRRFGPAYEQYLKDVPRWLPRFGLPVKSS